MNNSIIDELRNGGYLLFVRHGMANVGEDSTNLNFDDCNTQRNLSELGRRQAIYYGEMIRYLQIPIHYPVLASPLCRTIESAQLAFSNENVQVDPFLYELSKLTGNITPTEQKKILDQLQSILETEIPQGQNMVIVDHNFPEGIGLGQIPDMGTVIVKPLGPGNGYRIVSTLSLYDLGNLAV